MAGNNATFACGSRGWVRYYYRYYFYCYFLWFYVGLFYFCWELTSLEIFGYRGAPPLFLLPIRVFLTDLCNLFSFPFIGSVSIKQNIFENLEWHSCWLVFYVFKDDIILVVKLLLFLLFWLKMDALFKTN